MQEIRKERPQEAWLGDRGEESKVGDIACEGSMSVAVSMSRTGVFFFPREGKRGLADTHPPRVTQGIPRN